LSLISDIILSIYGVYRDYKVNRLDMPSLRTQNCAIEIVAKHMS
jgi:hypothetical protein